VCVDHQRRAIAPDAQGYAALPVGSRVTIGADDVRDLPRLGARPCTASASFVPKAGRTYFVGFETHEGRCAASVYREVTTNRMGLGVEPTLGPAADCLEG
jgi:hypothetical protein